MAKGVIVDPQHSQDWIVPRRVMCSFFWVGIILLFTGIILTVTSKHKGPTYRSWGAILMGLGFCLLLICLILCMHAYCVITVADEDGGYMAHQPLKTEYPPTPLLSNGGSRVVPGSSPSTRPRIIPPPNPEELKLENEAIQRRSAETCALNNGNVNYASCTVDNIDPPCMFPGPQKPRTLPLYSARVTELTPILEDSDAPLANGSPPQLSTGFQPHVRPIAPRAIRPLPFSITRFGVRQPYHPTARQKDVTISPPMELPKLPRGPVKSVAVIKSGAEINDTDSQKSSEEDHGKAEVDAGGSDISAPTIVMFSPEHGITDSKVSIYDNVHYIHL